MRNPILPTLAALVASSIAAPFAAAQADELRALRDQVRALEQRILELERRQDPQVAAPAPAAPAKVTVNDRGVTWASGDGANAVRLRGLVQADARQFFGDDGIANDAFVLRRARLISEGTFARHYSFQVVSEFGGTGAPSILDANLSLAWSEALQLKVGKFKVPVGLEQLQSDSWTFFNERSIATNLVPSRDLGLQASGELAGGRVSYAAGIFNGVPDAGSSTNTDFDQDKDVAGRLWLSPFKADSESPLRGLSFGVGGSFGRQKGTAGRAAAYRTDGQQTFFAYGSGVVSDGKTWRVSPQFDFRRGPFGLLGEYVLSTVNLRPAAAAPKAQLQNRAWQVAAGYVLTGEPSSPGGVAPRADFAPGGDGWGALEVAARVARVDVDEAAFPLFASPAASAAEATSFGFGLNWYLSKAAALKIDYYQTDFGFAAGAPAGPTAPVLQQDEKVLITRFQLGF
ncbi:MAG TPA: porin [Opitutaceae bacterium]|nr:porin [Opitutaceae bacterium]